MEDNLILVRLDDKYCTYLRRFDERVPFNYGKKKTRPFVGVLFSIGDFMYFAPLSSPKPKHLKLKSKMDFFKLDGGKLGAINFNNMIPVMEQNIIRLDLSVDNSDIENFKYIMLLRSQLRWLIRNKSGLYSRSKKIYDKYLDGALPSSVVDRCCNFRLLEEKCAEYNKK